MKVNFKMWLANKKYPLERNTLNDHGAEVRIKAELFTLEQMDIHGEKLARAHKISADKRPYSLLKQLAYNERQLTQSCGLLSSSDQDSMTPAALWLLENFYLIEEHIRLVRQLLPPDFGKGLPALVGDRHTPRIYDIANEIIMHSDGHWDVPRLSAFIRAYQRITPLTLGELWALPGMLRLALIDNLRHVGAQVADFHQQRHLAGQWVAKMLHCAQSQPADLIVVIADLAQKKLPCSSAFVAELIRRLQGSGDTLALALTWVKQRLADDGVTVATIIDEFNQQLAASQLSVSHSILGLRQLNETDWPDFTEKMSAVEALLQQDPADIYRHMHFDTRDNYRQQIEVISRHCPYSESQVASQILTLAQSAEQGSPQQHLGYYLIDQGRGEVEQRLQVAMPRWMGFRLRCAQTPLLSWLGSLSLLIAACTADLLFRSQSSGISALLWLLALPIAIVVSQFALNLLSEITTRARFPDPLPRMDFSAGIPADCATLVAIPCLLSSRDAIDHLLNQLEVCYLGNTQPYVYFALLTDFQDNPSRHHPADAELLAYAIQQIHALNYRYLGQEAPLFSLFHRAREFNRQQGVWMGYERKRGKLQALNRWLRGDKSGFTQVVGGNPSQLKRVKYVITLDSDTHLPRDSVGQMVATMAHPLNQPVYDAERQRVVAGYAILQPRLAEEVPRHGQSRYAALSSCLPGNDPYCCMSSDIYQDLFAEGSFIGKGIYDVDMFMQALAGVCPDNLVLSHDLLEGCYARSGVLSNVLLYEQYPANYLVDVARRTRWIRGDWQLLNWLQLRVRKADGSRCPNPLSTLSRWKLFDNLRRSLTIPSLLILIFSALTWVPNPLYWLVFLLTMLCLPMLLALLIELLHKSRRRPLKQHIRLVLCATLMRLRRLALRIATLPHEAGYSLLAIMVTLWRLTVSRRHLNEWLSSDRCQASCTLSVLSFYRQMWLNPCAGLLLSLLTYRYHPALIAVALPIGLLWLLTPALMSWLSRQPVAEKVAISDRQRAFLRQSARETWAFFDTFVNQQENWLPPDNYQEVPEPVIAHRTSPTNIGLSLLANLTAWDFGYITQGEVLRRIGQTLTTLDKLEHYRGHLYNWYDTRTLQPLSPRYISSVDSGNLAGHLLTLSAGLRAWRQQPLLDRQQLLAGLDDTLTLFEQSVSSAPPALLKKMRKLWYALANSTGEETGQGLQNMLALSVLLQQACSDSPSRVRRWSENLHSQLAQFSEEWSQLLAWYPCHKEGEKLPSLSQIAQWHPPASQQGTFTAARRASLAQAQAIAGQRLLMLSELEQRLIDHANMDFRFLYCADTHLLCVGYHCDENKLDGGKYDLLPSEIRLTQYFTIATNQLPMKSWFALGRLFTRFNKQSALMSWSGSMFEYLMPQLVMPAYPDTLLEKMCQSAVDRQIAWGDSHNIPWGISESGYAAYDSSHNYQYQAFGVPDLGLKRGLADNLVVAPYASMMALMVRPQAACDNLLALENLGARGEYGFYEALDYTPARLARGQLYIIIRSYMAHHQGMSFLALSHLLLNAPMVERFAANPVYQSARLLLQERMPDAVELYSPRRHFESVDNALKSRDQPLRKFTDAASPLPEVQLLANSRYQLMLTQAGGGYSRWDQFALTRWRNDATRDSYGLFCYLQDVDSGEVWSNSLQPTTGKASGQYQVIFSDAGAEFIRREGKLSAQTQIVVSPEDDVELRRLSLHWRGRQPKVIEITTYAEVVLAPAANDLTHPAFSNLFVQTELLVDREGILCHRRPREPDEACPWLFHMTAIHGDVERQTSFETDRAKFIGRGQTAADPLVLRHPGPLSNTAGAVVDPVIAVRHRIRLKPGVPLVIDMILGVTAERDLSLALLDKYRDHPIADRMFEMASSHSQIALRQINVNDEEADLFNRMAGSILFPARELRAEAEVILQNRRGQPSLWGYALSGDLPIVLLSISSSENMAMVTQLVKAHQYWRIKGLKVDLLILSHDLGGYQQALFHQILNLVAAGSASDQYEQPGGIFVRNSEHITPEDRALLLSVASIMFDDQRGKLSTQLKQRLQPAQSLPSALIPVIAAADNAPCPPAINTEHLQFFNGLGGFSGDGREYQVVLNPGVTTPAPWSNVLANDNFGTLISESGQAYSWYENAHEYRLTPWHNDPVCDSSGEAFYLRDEESGQLWSPTALPLRGEGSYLTRHGFGYSLFEHQQSGIASELLVLVPETAPVKLMMLTLKNHSGRTRKLSATGYVEWVLAELRSKSQMHIVTSPLKSQKGCAVLARNAFNSNGSERTAFFAVSGGQCSLSGDRREFLGRNGSLQQPAGMRQRRLSGRTGAALDPCAALQSAITLIDGDQHRFVFVLGLGEDPQQAESLIARFLDPDSVGHELDNIHGYWHRVLDKIQITTPDPAIDLLANGWLLYQTLSCRMMARSGYYQSGGAFGFRDQLQDSLALVYAAPQRLREQILLCASRQFIEGDVQHWWHPPTGNGVRTRCSDDFLWLPLAICHYLDATEDKAILDQRVSYLEARPLAAGEESCYQQPQVSQLEESLWQHGVRAIRHGLQFGQHGLPLMGAGDWNDGMNLVGIAGRGESVWLGFFFYYVLQRYGALAEKLGDSETAQLCREQAARLQQNLHEHGWDGGWYLRGYFDSGETLGSHHNAECQIDAIAQSWSVLSGAGEETRQRQAMLALDQHLVDKKNGLIKLLTPPFNGNGPNPGYIRGYLPGVRENGGQYTHGAIWAIMAFAEMGEIERAWQLMAMINPINHSRHAVDAERYKVEPYVICADIYSVDPHGGRGGWSWYTGSAGWAYRLIIESLLGLKRHGHFISFSTRLPADWPQVSLSYQQGSSRYQITIKRGQGEYQVKLDGQTLTDAMIPLADDGQEHQVEVITATG
ncbi:GH36-type glycosyl hydrolase domain-containing protein [Rouxiella aceris]